MSDEEFVEQVYHACYRRLVGQFFLICGGDMQTAEDIVCEAFVRAVTHAATFRRTDNPEAWLRRVALNVHHSRWRRIRKLDGLHAKLVTDAVASHVELSDDHLALTQALAELPPQQREALVLHHLGDWSLAQIAATLGVPVGTVKARLSRGRVALAAVLADSEGDPDGR